MMCTMKVSTQTQKKIVRASMCVRAYARSIVDIHVYFI